MILCRPKVTRKQKTKVDRKKERTNKIGVLKERKGKQGNKTRKPT